MEKTTQNRLDLRKGLEEVLAHRCKQNPRYSLRAFAQYLGMEPSFLSKILNGKRPITEKTQRRILEKLGSDARIGKSLNSLQGHEEDSPLLSYREIRMDEFELISDWHHFAILECMDLVGFKLSVESVSKTLGIHPSVAKTSIERLDRLGYFLKSKTGKILGKKANHTTTGSPHTAPAFRNLQKQILEKAVVAMEEIPIEERDQSSMTLAIDASEITEAKKALKDFRRKFTARFQNKDSKPNRVYHLSLSLYPVSLKTKKEGK